MRRAFMLALTALCLAGCGQSAKEKADLGQARSVVQRFAAAQDPSACDLMTTNALRSVYGDFKGPRKTAHANCVKKASGFKGDRVTIIKSSLIDDLTAKVVAHSSDEKFSFSVNLRRVAAGKPWRIDSISQAKLTQ